MTTPALLIGFIIASLFGAFFHFWRGGGLGRLVLYLLLGWAGFAAGHLLAARLNWTFDRFGPLHLGSASVMAMLFLTVGYWLSLVEVEKNPE